MKKITFAMIILLVAMLSVPIFAQGDAVKADDVHLGKSWKLGPSITIPPLRVQESVRSNAKLDVVLSPSIGGGLSFVYAKEHTVIEDGVAKTVEERIFSWSPFTVLLGGSTIEDVKNLDLSYAMTVGFFDDLIMTGFGYNFGSNVFQNEAGENVELSRWFYLVGFGMSFR